MALSVMAPALPWLVVAQDQRVPATFQGFFWQALPRAEGCWPPKGTGPSISACKVSLLQLNIPSNPSLAPERTVQRCFYGMSLGNGSWFNGSRDLGINPSWQQPGRVWEVGKILLLLPESFGLGGKYSQRNFWSCGGAQIHF